jgi:hypothetical protein
LPSVCTDFIGLDLIDQWKNICADIQSVNDKLVGMKISHGEIILAGDERVTQAGIKLFAWAEKYVSMRVERRKHRSEEAAQKYDRIYRELLPDLEKIAFRQGSVNRCFMV